MKLTSLAISLLSASLPLMAQTGADTTPLITDASQFVAGAGSGTTLLLDGDPSTVWQSDGLSFTVKVPDNILLTNGTPFRIRFSVPAGADDIPVAFTIYGSHDENGVLKSKTCFGYTNEQISYDGSMTYESPTFYVRDEFHDQYWACTHLQFECTEMTSDEAARFRLGEFQIVLYDEYTLGEGALLRNDGKDIINSAGISYLDKSWYKPLVDEVGHSFWNAADYTYIWGAHPYTGLIITPQAVDEPTPYTLRVGRPANDVRANGFPTLMKWSYRSSEGGEWIEGGTLDFSTVSPGELYDYPRFIIRPEYRQLLFETLENVGNERLESWAGGQPNTVLSRFQFYGPIKVYTPVPDPLPALGVPYPNPNKVQLNQQFFCNKLYSKVLADFSFEHTHGIVDQNFDNNFYSDGGWLTNKSIWDDEGHLLPGIQIPGSELGVALPDFSYDAPINSAEVRPEGRDHRRQPTSTIYHEVYAIPGERVDLIPYSDIWHRSNYLEDFYRFYDYMTDKAHPDVYFLYNPRMGAYSEDGLFGGRALGYAFDSPGSFGDFDWNDNGPELRGPGGVASFYHPAGVNDDEYIDAYIAADYSQHYYTDASFSNPAREADIKRFIDVDNKTIHEPIINFRHVFHVVDGRKFADESSKDAATNEAFLAQQLNLFYAPTGKDFKIRLINPIPEDEHIHSLRYYRKKDGSYERIGTYEIQTFRYDGYKRGERIPDMFVPDERSKFYTVDTSLETELNPGLESTDAWIDPGEAFYRSLSCPAEKAQTGTYLVRLVAKTTEGEKIYLDGGDPDGMSLRDIIITFLDDQHASFTLEKDIPLEHSEAYLEENFQNKSVVDFDKYMALSGNPDFMEKSPSGEGERIKYPAPWKNTEYAFGYKYLQDYSTYTIASHTSCVPYAQATIDGTVWDQHDRLYSNTGGREKGFFFYANAAGDPGVMARVDIPGMCVGSTIHVSAWINSMGVYMGDDYKNNESANVNFDLVAVMKDGSEININNFSTGYVPNDPEHCGKWMHTYYSVTPDFSVINNGNFNVREVDHFQVVLVNNSVNSNGADYAIDDIRIYISKPTVMAHQLKPLCQGETEVCQRIDMPFRNLLNSISAEIADDVSQGQDISLCYAILDKDKFDSLVDSYGGYTSEVFEGAALPVLSGDTHALWNTLYFNTAYENNISWTSDLPANTASRLNVDGLDCISYNIILRDGGLHAGKRYVLAVALPDAGDLPDWTDFDISDNCTKQAEFEITGSTVIKVDGIVHAASSDLEICENQFPVVQVDIIGIEASTGDIRIVDKTPLADWFRGSMEEFSACSFDGMSLDEALLNFRHIYPEATSTDMPYTALSAFSYDAACRSVLEHFIAEGILELASYSFLSSAVRFPEGVNSTRYSIVVIPANRQEDREIDGHLYIICNDPSELCVNVTKRAPGLLDGFENAPYPESMQDVPLRIGLRHLDSTLHMPMRSLYIVTPGVSALKASADNALYLVRTDDPEFRDLEIEPGAADEGTGLREVGQVLDVKALKALPAEANATIQFDNTGFKEGYFYTLRFNYSEENADGQTSLALCDGQAIFTLKIVAEYQMWTGDADGSANFNNDSNWRRVSHSELLGDSVEADLVTDGDNDRSFSFSPLSFTKTIIPCGDSYPWLFAPSRSDSFEVYDGRSYFTGSFATGLSDSPQAGKATADISFDMVPLDEADNIYCRLWEANNCAEIHFLSGSEITNQQHLVYGKAWVDMELQPSRWYTLASPLQAVVAGDMYLPSASGRQETELFIPISFSKDLNDRFRPAVYQRGWDKGEARVFELPSQSAGEVRDVAVALDWSDVYNDVTEQYAPGVGFSVKTDVSAMRGEIPDFVLFRFPKDDSSYEYWTQDGLDHGIENGGQLNRSGAGRLNPADMQVTLSNASSGRYFLAGNPFMAHLDMARFLEANRNVINSKYWIMTAGSQQCAVMSESSGGFVGSLADASTIAPMQGFFVESVAETETVSLRFSPDMIVTDGADSPLLRSPGRMNSSSVMRITADVDGMEASALLALCDGADAGYNDSEDAVLLLSSDAEMPLPYTIAGNRALSLNATPSVEGTEVGLAANEAGRHVSLRFSNVPENLALYDALSGEFFPLSEDTSYEADGNIAARLYIVSADRMAPDMAPGIKLTVDGDVVTAIAPGAGSIGLSVYDLSGKCVASVSSGCDVASVCGLAKGFYLATASVGKASVTEKIIVR